MSLPVFKDWNKGVEDLFKDDFDLKYSLKVKAAGPFGINVTQTTEFSSKGGKTALNGKVSAKWAHESGFTLDKLEVKSDGSIVTESSLNGVYPGLKFDFKGDDNLKGDLSATYKCSAASVTGEVDLVDFSGVKASVWGAVGPAYAGANLDYRLVDSKSGEKSDLKTFDVAASYPVNNLFFGLKTSNKFSKYDASVSIKANDEYTVGGLFSFSPEKSAVSGAFALAFNQNPSTAIKVKVDTEGIVAASVKRTISKGVSIVGATELDIRDPTAFKLGVTTTLG